jgi:hypothetical protein
MVRYVQRPWYHPIGFMSHSLPAYPVAVITIATCLMYPFRYIVADGNERAMQDPQSILKQEAMLFYHTLDDMMRRTTYNFRSIVSENGDPGQQPLAQWNESLQTGKLETDRSYMDSHHRDMTRAHETLKEIRDLRAKLGKE